MPISRKIGFIGLGHMGIAMATRLLEAGVDLTVYNRTEAKAQALLAKGAKLAHKPSELRDCDIVITMLADDKAVSDVVDGENGFAPTLKKGAFHIAMSSISIELSKRLAKEHADRGQHYVAAPVLGRPDAAAAGKLFIFAAGVQANSLESVFAAMGQRTFFIEGNEAWRAHLIKLAFNFTLGSVVETLAEAFALTRKAGFEAPEFLEMVTSTLFGSPVYKNYGGLMAEKKYKTEGGFTMALAAKDLRLALAAADQLQVPMPLAGVVREQMMQVIGRGDSDLDWSGLGKMAAENAGLKP